jgi:hypothetical protein
MIFSKDKARAKAVNSTNNLSTEIYDRSEMS